ncbi:putative serine protease HtrA [Peptoclostridium acidaminophilum DSM 3953]|uniref:Putative serine protease HtrA n=1 Tax=Peptoclostridium acidaminophilum DSM 3953 TaxID=1286171 RepID=W8T6U4_PEPAC|nr:trypsin-like peptidase domain-containing protein [Peptoclostridium acidaminophilum]AHM57464.1 putative serine protease HtrA [Peptoclostridium acidaminophilum DSM 3953]
MGKGLVAGIIGAVIGTLLTIYTVFNVLPDSFLRQGSTEEPTKQTLVGTTAKEETVYKAVAKKAMPSVVGITTVTVQQDFFFGDTEQSGVGTGVIVDSRGYILTNAHVISSGQAKNVTVLFYDGTKEEAQVLWYDSLIDLAVIKVEKQDLDVAELGDSDGVEVGDIAIAIGNPLGLEFERSVTQGIISGLNRSIDINQYETMENLIQTDASINPGNSGGPLLDSQGKVIGINTAKIQTAEGLGFAIPIDLAKPIVKQFIEKGRFEKVVLGIQGVNVARYEQASGEDLPAETGVYVLETVSGSAAAKAGIKAGDVIIKIGKADIKSMGNLVRELYKLSPGDETTVTVDRSGKAVELNVKL